MKPADNSFFDTPVNHRNSGLADSSRDRREGNAENIPANFDIPLRFRRWLMEIDK